MALKTIPRVQSQVSGNNIVMIQTLNCGAVGIALTCRVKAGGFKSTCFSGGWTESCRPTAVFRIIPFLEAQGFVNLDFESANVKGYRPGTYIPLANALPGWNAYLFNSDGTNATTQIAYDGISAGGEFISIVDTNVGYSTLYPIQGKYTAWLFSGGGQEPFYSAEISQTGLVPAGTESLLFYALNFGSPFVVTLGGQVLNVVPVQTFSNYTEYGANIASFADETEALSFIQPPATGVVQPGYLELDDIQFSPTSIVPEPSIFGLTAIGAIALGRYRWRKATK